WQLLVFVEVKAQSAQLLAESQDSHATLTCISDCVVGQKKRAAPALVKGFYVMLFDISDTGGFCPLKELAEILGDLLGQILDLLMHSSHRVVESLIRILQQQRRRHSGGAALILRDGYGRNQLHGDTTSVRATRIFRADAGT